MYCVLLALKRPGVNSYLACFLLYAKPYAKTYANVVNDVSRNPPIRGWGVTSEMKILRDDQ